MARRVANRKLASSPSPTPSPRSSLAVPPWWLFRGTFGNLCRFADSGRRRERREREGGREVGGWRDPLPSTAGMPCIAAGEKSAKRDIFMQQPFPIPTTTSGRENEWNSYLTSRSFVFLVGSSPRLHANTQQNMNHYFKKRSNNRDPSKLAHVMPGGRIFSLEVAFLPLIPRDSNEKAMTYVFWTSTTATGGGKK